MYIAFDVGNVLVKVDFEKFFKEFNRLAANLGWGNENPLTFLNDIQAQQDIGVLTIQVGLKERYKLGPNQINRLVEAWNESIIPNKEMLSFVSKCKEMGYKVAILSNMGKEHAEYVRRVYPEIFNDCILHLSCEVGVRKPTKLYYQSFLMQHSDFEGCIFVDDRRENLEVAEKFGMIGMHFILEEFALMNKKARVEYLKNFEYELIKTWMI